MREGGASDSGADDNDIVMGHGDDEEVWVWAGRVPAEAFFDSMTVKVVPFRTCHFRKFHTVMVLF
jgi:hypothetical protein